MHRSRAALFALVTVYYVPALAQQSDTNARLNDLERRVRALEIQRSAALPTTLPDRAKWRSIRIGMTMDEVRGILGEPSRIELGPTLTFWRYAQDASVTFSSSRGNTVYSLNEPH